MVAKASNASPEPIPAANAEMDRFMFLKTIATAPAWMPEPGDTLLGVIVHREIMPGKDGFDPYPAMTYRLDDGTYKKVHAIHTLLQNQYREKGTDIGRRQFLSYEGKRKKNNPTPDEVERKLDEYHLTFLANADEELKETSFDF